MSNMLNLETIAIAEIQSSARKAEREPYRPVVLIVDEEEIIADTRAAIFTSWGYAVMTAYDAVSALEIAGVIPPELLVADIELSGSNGVCLAIQMRELVPDCKVLLVSGQQGGVNRFAASVNEIRGFSLLIKPVHPEAMRERVAELTRGSHRDHFFDSRPDDEERLTA